MELFNIYISVLRKTSFQQLTFQISHLYYNWNGTMRMPAARDYASRLAKNIGDDHLGGEDEEDPPREFHNDGQCTLLGFEPAPRRADETVVCAVYRFQ